MGYWTPIQSFNFAIVAISLIGYVVAAILIAIWVWDLRNTENPLYPIFPTMVGIKATLAIREAGNLWGIFFNFDFPPLATLPGRVVLLVFVAWQVWAVIRYRTLRGRYRG